LQIIELWVIMNVDIVLWNVRWWWA